MSAHRCHADGCEISIHPRFLMCPRYWHMVPPEIQQEVWRAYVPGQEVRKDPTKAYLAAFHKAVAARENRATPFPVEASHA